MQLTDRIIQEKQVVELMIALYCRKQHGTKTLCSDCQALLCYAHTRIEKCPFQQNKTFCSTCKVHCYQAQMRAKIKEVMRFSGPRMLWYHPSLAVKHLIQTRKEKR